MTELFHIMWRKEANTQEFKDASITYSNGKGIRSCVIIIVTSLYCHIHVYCSAISWKAVFPTCELDHSRGYFSRPQINGIFLIYPEKRFDISCTLSPIYFKLSSAEFLPSMLSVGC